MTADELRAKFEAWWVYHFRDGNGPPPSRRLSGTGIYTVEVDEILWTTWQAAYASRDAEVEALRKRINNAPVYYVPVEKPIDEDGWVQVIGSVKALNNMRGKHVRLVIDEAIDAAMREE